MSKQNVSAVRITRLTLIDPVARFNDDTPTIHGERGAYETLDEAPIASPLELEDRIFNAIDSLHTHLRPQELLVSTASGARGIAINSMTASIYSVEVCVKGRWRRLHGKKAQRAVDHDLALAKKAIADLASDAAAEDESTTVSAS